MAAVCMREIIVHQTIKVVSYFLVSCKLFSTHRLQLLIVILVSHGFLKLMYEQYLREKDSIYRWCYHCWNLDFALK